RHHPDGGEGTAAPGCCRVHLGHEHIACPVNRYAMGKVETRVAACGIDIATNCKLTRQGRYFPIRSDLPNGVIAGISNIDVARDVHCYVVWADEPGLGADSIGTAEDSR